ncbi:MAG: CBS domain-containing protein [Bdellovibrionaceae bacterium]|nr:CBS domain-containing protein [Pseudobdellovibrionaceae bacterium]MBX3034973.1 CBS domain-containing protein [Pseudobdellovibrionaceae bacterium]
MEQHVESYMVKGPYVGEGPQSVKEALEVMRECEIRHLPVVEENHLIGLVSERDLREAMALPQGAKLRLEDVMKRNVYVAESKTPLREIIQEMADMKYGSVVVVDGSREVVGIFTTTDALRLLSEMLEDEDETEDELAIEDYMESWRDDDERIIGRV